MNIVINYWAILISMAVSVILGFLWYGPLFGKKWMALSGIAMPAEKPKFSTMLKPMAWALLGAFFMSYLMSMAIGISASVGATGVMCALTIAFTNWLGFIVPIHLNSVGWEGKPWTLFFIHTGYWLVFLLISGTIISALTLS